MTTEEAMHFCAKVQIGSYIEAKKLVMRVDSVTKKAFVGQSIYKGKDRGLTYLFFDILLNPHYETPKIIDKPKY